MIWETLSKALTTGKRNHFRKASYQQGSFQSFSPKRYRIKAIIIMIFRSTIGRTPKLINQNPLLKKDFSKYPFTFKFTAEKDCTVMKRIYNHTKLPISVIWLNTEILLKQILIRSITNSDSLYPLALTSRRQSAFRGSKRYPDLPCRRLSEHLQPRNPVSYTSAKSEKATKLKYNVSIDWLKKEARFDGLQNKQDWKYFQSKSAILAKKSWAELS